MEIPAQSDRFTPLQLQMLRLFSYDLPEEELTEIRDLITQYFARKVTVAADKSLEGTDVNEWAEELKNQHLRTPYRPHKGVSFKKK